jgi:hypothetical protein
MSILIWIDRICAATLAPNLPGSCPRRLVVDREFQLAIDFRVWIICYSDSTYSHKKLEYYVALFVTSRNQDLLAPRLFLNGKFDILSLKC